MPQFLRGAVPTPRYRLLAAPAFRPVEASPPQFAVVPKKLSIWGNDRYGDCVTAEEAFAVAAYSIMAGVPQIFIPENNVIDWAYQHGVLNGAGLTEVMDDMQRSGLSDNVKTWQDGPYHGVDFSDEAVLQAAIAQGPVKAGIDADALPGAAGDHNGWWTTSNRRFYNEDHCIGYSGFGRADFLFDALGAALPSGLSPSTPGYIGFSWGTCGFVTHDWIRGCTYETWVRQPTTVGLPTPTPNPGPTPGPTPPPAPPPAPPPLPRTFSIDVPDQPVYGQLGRYVGTVPAHRLTGTIQ